MPRKSRIDTADALHHIMVRGIEGSKIFRNDTDRDNFLERLGKVLQNLMGTLLSYKVFRENNDYQGS